MHPSSIAERLSKQQRHERYCCAFTHVKIAWFFVVFSGIEVFSSWRALGKPISAPKLFDLPFYILVVVFYTPAFFWVLLRCFAERFVMGISVLHMTMAVISSFLPGVFDPHAGLVSRSFLGLWLLAFLLSLRMPFQALRNPAITPADEIPEIAGKARFIWVAIIVITSFLRVALGYFAPSVFDALTPFIPSQ